MPLSARRPPADAALTALLRGAMVLVAALLLVRQASDPDFFWHLKTGEWIWQHRELPASDPFSYASQAATNAEQRFTLTAYWASQVAYHLVHAAAGMPGILALKLLLAAALVPILLRLRRGDPLVHAALVLAALTQLCAIYPFDRPHVFSFLFFAALLVLLEKERNRGEAAPARLSWLPVPLVMLLWANMHGGHVLGQITLLLFAAAEGVKFAHPALGPPGPERYRRLLLVCAAGLAASLASPNTWHGLGQALTTSTVQSYNTEYVSTVTFFRGQPLVAVFWGALALCALALLSSWRTPDITWILLLGVLGYQGFRHNRYVPFFMIAALPVLGAWLSAGPARLRGRHLLVAGAVALAAWSVGRDFPGRDRLGLALRVNENVYPVRAADFILSAAPRGNLYNTYFWGGYLLWRLAPERKVFVDGRGLNQHAIFQSFLINAAFANPGETPPLWQRLLQQSGVGCLLVPRVAGSQGMAFDGVGKLRRALLEAPEWVPVFADAISLVFVLDTEEHRELIRRHGIPRARLLPAPARAGGGM